MRNIARRIALLGTVAALVNCGRAPTPSKLVGSMQDAPSAGAAAKPQLADVRVDVAAPRARGVDHAASATEVARVLAKARGLSADTSFRVTKSLHGVDGRIHTRLQQTHRGIRVWGADIVVHEGEDITHGVSGNVLPNLGDLDTVPALEAASAIRLAKLDGIGDRAIKTTRESSELVVWRDKAESAHLAFHTVFFHEKQGALDPHLWNHIVDAHSGKVLARWNGIHTVEQASGPGGNPKFVHAWNNELDVEKSGSSYKADTDRLRTLDMKEQTSGGSVANGPLDKFSDAAIDDAHGYAEITLNMLKDWQGYNSIDNEGFKILSRVHYDENYENAFWDGEQMTYGDGADMFYPLSGALDVCAHEINHGFTTFHSNLDYDDEPGGLNESFSDIAGVVATFFAFPEHASFDLGPDVFKADGEALRYMCDPTKDGVSIETAEDMTSSLDPHYSSGVMNKAFCRAAKRFSSGDPEAAKATQAGVQRVSKPWYSANATYWTQRSTFKEACQGVYDAARALGYSDTELGYIRDSWSDVGVFCGGAKPPPPKCDKTFTDDSGDFTSENYPNNYDANTKYIWCIEPESGKAATLSFSSFATEADYDFVEVFGEDGSSLDRASGNTAPKDATGKRLVIKFTSDGSVQKKGFKASWSSR